MKKPKLYQTAPVPLDQIVRAPHRCAWKGCTEATLIGDAPPKDWRWLALYWGPVGIPPWLSVQDRDAVLCPKHARLLHEELLEDIGQRLEPTKGRS